MGRGGQGTVWLVADRLHGNARVALKVVTSSPGDSREFQGLSREFMILSRLAHPNVARVRDFGILHRGDGAYFTTDYVRGEDLLTWALGLRGREKWHHLIDAATQALSVLQYLSLRGLRHGDVKPQNLLIEKDAARHGERPLLKFIDFGTSRLKASTDQDGKLAGTPAYLPGPNTLHVPEGPDPDLYGLGMSLFHAAVGRLPFAVGDPEALRAWWKARAPARPGTFDPSVPAVLDSLIAGLTIVGSKDGLRSAAEALELLKSRVTVPPCPRPRGADESWFTGREGFVESLVERLSAPRVAPRVHVIVAPRESGKSRVLESLDATLQAQGYPTVLFRHPGDDRALREVHCAVREILGREFSAGGPPLETSQIHRVLESVPFAILLDDDRVPGEANRAGASPEEGCLAFLRGVARFIRRQRTGRRRSPLFVAAAAAPQSLAEVLGIDAKDLEIHPLKPLSVESVADAAREFFAVEEIPDDIVQRIQRESSGSPRRVREALERLADHGASSDFLGQLTVPRPLPARLVLQHDLSASTSALPPRLRRALGLILLAGEPLGAERAADLFPETESEGWRSRLEGLRWRGIIRREEREPEPCYHATSGCDGDAIARACLGNDEGGCRRALQARHLEALRSSRRPPPDTSLAAAGNSLVLGNPSLAVRFAMRARSRTACAERDAALPALLVRILEFPAESWNGEAGWGAARALLLVRARSAELLTKLGRFEEALNCLGACSAGDPSWYEAKRLWIRAEAHERSGDVSSAIEALEGLRQIGSRSSGSRGSAVVTNLASFEAAARLAALCFRAGRTAQGRAYLEEGRGLLQERRGLPSQERGPLFCRILGLFASAESAHGDAGTAVRFLEEALRLAREWQRNDLSLRPLNELGILYGQHQRWSDALGAFEEIERISREMADSMGALKAIYNRAIIYYRLHDLDRAEALFREARRLSDVLGHHSFSAVIWLGFASVLRERGRVLGSLRLYRRVIHDAESARANDVAVAHNNVSEIYLLLGRLAKAMMHADLSFRIAKRTENRFLLCLALRSRGMARFAVGRTREARRDLERALELAEKDEDVRARSVASYYLGLVAWASRDLKEAIRQLHAARVWARRARDLPHLHAATVALLGVLVRLGRIKAAHRILGRAGDRQPAWARGSHAARILGLRVRGDLPQNLPELVTICRDGIRSGNVWETFCALQDLLEEPTLPANAKGALLLERSLIASRIVRRLPARYVALFRHFWDAALERRSGALGLSPPRVPPGPILAGPDSLAPGTDLVQGVLEDIRGASGACSAWLLMDPHVDSRACFWAGEDATILSGILADRREVVDRARKTAVLVEAWPHLLLRLPHPRAVRILGVELRLAGSKDGPSVKDEILQRSTLLSLALRILEHEAVLSVERTLLAEARDEIHRLNALLMKGRQELDTELLTSRLKRLEIRRQLESHASGTEVLHRIPMGVSTSMMAILDRIPRIAAQNIPVLLLGECGVGKDLIARRIHELGPRRTKPFVAEICNIAESLMEAELFGFVEGAFTGAIQGRPGIFERASGGTIYLDEIAGLEPSLQARLLRVIEEKQVRPIGSERLIPVDFRLLSSSSMELDDLRKSPGFRKDLLYRINAEILHIPPLRDRREDIPVLAAYFLSQHAGATDQRVPHLHPRALEQLLNHPWPGNVRELENVMQRVLVERPLEITAELLFPDPQDARNADVPGRPGGVTLPAFKEERRRVERDLLLRALSVHGGNASGAARSLRITRRYLGTLLEKHGIQLGAFKESADRLSLSPNSGKTASPPSLLAESGGRRKKRALRNRRPGTP